MSKKKPRPKDVAAYILQKHGPMSHMKLQKLLYYSQAWSLVWDDKPLFDAQIEAWVNGPVVRVLYAELRTQFQVSQSDIKGAEPNRLDAEERATVDAVLGHYGDRSAQWLSDLTHMEHPWRAAREGLAPNERSQREITQASMAEYYSSL